jgi:hypothetical protein
MKNSEKSVLIIINAYIMLQVIICKVGSATNVWCGKLSTYTLFSNCIPKTIKTT